MATIAIQATSSGTSGHTKRRKRLSSQVAYDRPSLRAARQLTPFAYPPTMKKIGMTCTIHVSQALQATAVNIWAPIESPLAARQGAAASQCLTDTARIDAARRKST